MGSWPEGVLAFLPHSLGEAQHRTHLQRTDKQSRCCHFLNLHPPVSRSLGALGTLGTLQHKSYKESKKKSISGSSRLEKQKRSQSIKAKGMAEQRSRHKAKHLAPCQTCQKASSEKYTRARARRGAQGFSGRLWPHSRWE